MEVGGGGTCERGESKEEVGVAEMGLAEDARWWAGAESLEGLIPMEEWTKNVRGNVM